MKRKMPAHEAALLIKRHVANVTDARLLARPESDDAGKHIVLYIECTVPDSPLPPLVKAALEGLREHDWCLVAIKVPYGWVEVMEGFLGRD
jgi:hypothetical protein